MKFTIDRFEGDFAIIELENMDIVEIPAKILPANSREGDIIKLEIDCEETSLRKQRIEEKFNKLLWDE